MNLTFKKTSEPYEWAVTNENNDMVGRGYLVEFQASDLYEKRRMNYFVDVEIDVEDPGHKIGSAIISEMVTQAKKERAKYPDQLARAYHCCFTDKVDLIEFYKSIDGFQADEGMHILHHDLKSIPDLNPLASNLRVVEDNFKTEEDMQAFVDSHVKVFSGHPYSVDKLIALKKEPGFKSIGVYDGETIVGNIMVQREEEDGQVFGWIEDMYVSRSHRKRGIANHLVIMALAYCKEMGLLASRLEVWSANARANGLYDKVGYKLLKSTEVSIGMSI